MPNITRRTLIRNGSIAASIATLTLASQSEIAARENGAESVPQGSPKTGHTGSPPIRPHGWDGLLSQAGLWKSRQLRCLGNRCAIPTFPQPQQQHHLICKSVERKTTAFFALESKKRRWRSARSRLNTMAGFLVTPYGRIDGDP